MKSATYLRFFALLFVLQLMYFVFIRDGVDVGIVDILVTSLLATGVLALLDQLTKRG